MHVRQYAGQQSPTPVTTHYATQTTCLTVLTLLSVAFLDFLFNQPIYSAYHTYVWVPERFNRPAHKPGGSWSGPRDRLGQPQKNQSTELIKVLGVQSLQALKFTQKARLTGFI